MKRSAIIVCLSACKRGEPLTTTRPYALLPLLNKELVLHQIETLSGMVDEIILVVNEKSESVIQTIKGKDATSRISSITISEKNSLLRALKDAELIIPSDLIFLGKPILAAKHALLVTKEGSEEQEAALSLIHDFDVEIPHEEIETLRVNYPWEIVTANQALCKRVTTRIDPSVKREENVVLHGPVVIGKNTVLKANTYIEGPVVIGEGCEIGPFCHLRPETCIGDGCRIGKTEIVDSILFPGVTSKHAAYLGHSVIGADVNIGAFTVTADYRHDGKTHITLAYETGKAEKVDTKRRKLGAFLGDKVHTAISTSIYPGRKLWPGTGTLPGEAVKEDKRG